MKTVKGLIKTEADGTLSFGDFSLKEKTKVSDFNHDGGSYKVKSFNEITKLERNEAFVYESVPGSAVFNYAADAQEVSFLVACAEEVQITLELEPEADYDVFVEGNDLGTMKTNIGGKLTFSVQASPEVAKEVKIIKA